MPRAGKHPFALQKADNIRFLFIVVFCSENVNLPVIPTLYDLQCEGIKNLILPQTPPMGTKPWTAPRYGSK
jgi:hypothetical protein